MIKVTFEYATVDEAIVALGKLVGTAPAKANSTAATSAHAAVPATSTRRGRSDKGQARGSYKNPPTEPTVPAQAPVASTVANPPLESVSGTVAPEPAAPDVILPSTPAPTPSVPETPAAAAPIYSQKDVQEAVATVFKAKNLATAMDVLKRFGANTYRDVLPAQYAEFIKHAIFVSEGGQV